VLAGAAWFDLAISMLLAAAIVMIGQALVQYEIFSGRTLPRRELRRQWSYALVLAGGYGLIVGGSLAYGLRPIYALLLSAILMVAVFALAGWRTFTRQQEFVRRLHPFVASTHLYEQLTAQAADEHAGKSEAGQDVAESTFAALCSDVLNTSYAALIPAGSLALLISKPLTHPARVQAPPATGWMREVERASELLLPLQVEGAPQAAWAIPLRSGGQFAGALLLGNRNDGGIYLQEEIEVARATGERLIDLRASAELVQRLLKVQRMRIVETTVLDRQTRRTLHDDLLPDLHTALLLLNLELSTNPSANLQAAGDLLVEAHRRTAELLRTIPLRPALQPGVGILPTLRKLLATDFEDRFDCVEWTVPEEAEVLAAHLPAVTAEVVYYAVREVIRNAARYGRGGDDSRPLALHVSAHAEDGLQIVVEDNGVGISPTSGEGPGAHSEARSAPSSGQGISLHTALLAVVGATLSVTTSRGSGTRVAIHLPPSACSNPAVNVF
jgi:signal transduction histidine kinase